MTREFKIRSLATTLAVLLASQTLVERYSFALVHRAPASIANPIHSQEAELNNINLPHRQPAGNQRLWHFSPVRDFSRGLDASAIQPIGSLREMNSGDISMIIPASDLQPTSDGSKVAVKIIDHSLSNFFNSPAVRTSDLGRTAVRVEKHMESDIALGGGSPHSIQHNVKFAMRPTQTRAIIEYTGVTNAQLTYNAASSIVDLEVKERIAAFSTDFVYNHINMPSDTRNTVSLRWIW